MVRGSLKEKLHWIFCFYDIDDDGILTKQVDDLRSFFSPRMFDLMQTLETVVRSLYDLLGQNVFIQQPVTDETVEKHSAILFEVDRCRHVRDALNIRCFLGTRLPTCWKYYDR